MANEPSEELKQKSRSDDPLVQPIIDVLYDENAASGQKLEAIRDLKKLDRGRDKRSAMPPVIDYLKDEQQASRDRALGAADASDRRDMMELAGTLAIELVQDASDPGLPEVREPVVVLIESVGNTAEHWSARKKAIEMLALFAEQAPSEVLAYHRRTLETAIEKMDLVIQKELAADSGWFFWSTNPDASTIKAQRNALRAKLDTFGPVLPPAVQ